MDNALVAIFFVAVLSLAANKLSSFFGNIWVHPIGRNSLSSLHSRRCLRIVITVINSIRPNKEPAEMGLYFRRSWVIVFVGKNNFRQKFVRR
jgi:hypothetical protein